MSARWGFEVLGSRKFRFGGGGGGSDLRDETMLKLSHSPGAMLKMHTLSTPASSHSLLKPVP